jgi:hypothetical protein
MERWKGQHGHRSTGTAAREKGEVADRRRDDVSGAHVRILVTPSKPCKAIAAIRGLLPDDWPEPTTGVRPTEELTGNERCMHNLAGLLNRTAISAQGVALAVLLLQQRPNVRRRPLFQRQLGGDALSALGQVTDAQSTALHDEGHAEGALAAALQSLLTLEQLLEDGVRQRFVDAEEIKPSLSQADATLTMLRTGLATLAVRPVAFHGIAGT